MIHHQALADSTADARLVAHLRERIRCASVAELAAVLESFDEAKVCVDG